MSTKPWTSNVTKVERDRLTTCGVDQQEIISSFSYEEMVYLLIFGKKPSPVESDLLRAVIVSHCSHGITGQSTLAVRMAADCGAGFLNAALGGFSVGSGSYHQGGLEVAMRELQRAVGEADVERYVVAKLATKERIFGFGHRFHSFDPRARDLMALCDRHSFLGKHIQMARRIDGVLSAKKGIRMNIEAAGGAILLDLGFPIEAACLIILVGRGPMFAAAFMERLREGNKPFPRIEVSDVLGD